MTRRRRRRPDLKPPAPVDQLQGYELPPGWVDEVQVFTETGELVETPNWSPPAELWGDGWDETPDDW